MLKTLKKWRRKPPSDRELYRQHFGEFPGSFEGIHQAVKPDTKISRMGVYANLQAVTYVCENGLPGAVVETGVWRGGSIKAMLLQLLALGDAERDVYLFDTFAGMTAPSATDLALEGKQLQDSWARQQHDDHNEWCFAPLETVEAVLATTAYPTERLHLVKGDVRDTVPATASSIGHIAVLRLDTDWYESTKVEIEYLYDLLVPGGVMIIDDYGRWEGQRQAVDAFFTARGFHPFLHRIAPGKRLMIKPGQPQIDPAKRRSVGEHDG